MSTADPRAVDNPPRLLTRDVPRGGRGAWNAAAVTAAAASDGTILIFVSADMDLVQLRATADHDQDGGYPIRGELCRPPRVVRVV